MQVEAGAQLLQVFEAMAAESLISRESLDAHALPHMREIAAELKARHPATPLMVFPRGASYALPALLAAGYDVLTLDDSVPRDEARGRYPGACLQGNFDPKLLVDGTAEGVRGAAVEMLDALGAQKLIANLCEGLGGKEKPELVAALVDAIHQYDARGGGEGGGEGGAAEAAAPPAGFVWGGTY